MVIREFAYPQDYAQVIALWEQAGSGIHIGRSDTQAEIAKKLQRDPDLFLVAEEEAKIIGAVLGGFDGRRGMMYHLAVHPDHRRRGIGSLLMLELEKRFRKKGCLRYYLLVTRENEKAIRFYEARACKRLDLYVYGKDID